MFAYRFRINFEDQDGFVREFELGVDQTFMDLRNAIIENLSQPSDAYTSFFLCDHQFRKKTEIFHPDYMGGKSSKNHKQQDAEKRPTMDKAALNEFIDDPHQKMVMIFDEKNEWTFYIELVRIVKTKKDESFPRLVNSVGGIPIELRPRKEILSQLNNESTDEDEETENDILDDEDQEQEEEHEGYDDDELNNLNDNDFYNESIEGGKDIDENKP
ncbi:MAG: IS1096 element passenger TnpR family protein [Bacteroidota bacterium]